MMGVVLRVAVAATCLGCGRLSFDQLGASGSGDPDANTPTVDAAIPNGANVAFVSSTMIEPGMIGGTAAADALCAQLASAAGLPGTSYAAWLSSTTSDVIDRLGTARGWVRPDGLAVADLTTDLGSSSYYSLNVDEHVTHLASPIVITASSAAGRVDLGSGAYGTCADFTNVNDTLPVASGGAGATGGGCFGGFGTGCAQAEHLYCLGIDHSQAVGVVAAQGRSAFVSQGTWQPGGGLASADAFCQAEAAGAGLSGTFRALLATTSASAASRFGLGGLPWVRRDGLRLARTPDELMAGNLDASLSTSASGAPTAAGAVWTGYSASTKVGTDVGDATCNDWTSKMTSQQGGVGSPATAGPSVFGLSSGACNTTYSLYCLQQ